LLSEPRHEYNRGLMEAILWGWMDYLGAEVNTEIIPLEKAIQAYRVFDDGSLKKFAIDPHGSVPKQCSISAELRHFGSKATHPICT
jgi:glutathione-independent formaldehyde dehydrogenase